MYKSVNIMLLKNISGEKNEVLFYPPYKIKGFTLSEVLITLVVIGVVAAITVPVMIADWQKQATVERLKKSYSTIANALTRAVADNGPAYTWESTSASSTSALFMTAKDFAETYLTPYLNVSKVCEYGKDAVCDYKVTAIANSNSFSSKLFYSSSLYAFVLTDGTTVVVGQPTVAANDIGIHFLELTIDINGSKKPNKFGRDVATIYFYTDGNQISPKLMPGCNNCKTREEHMTACRMISMNCLGVIAADGWQIKKDYPW